MHLFLVLLAALGSFPAALSFIVLLRPPSFTGRRDPSEHPVHVMGSTINLQWTQPEGRRFSVVLYQLSDTQAANFNGEFTPGSFEFITRDSVDLTSFTWVVATAQNLSYSSMFSIAVWQEGAQVTDSATNIFNITRGEIDGANSNTAAPAPTSLTSTTTSSASPSATPSGGAGPATESNLPAADQSPAAGLSTGAIVGIAIGVAAAVAFLVSAAWYLGRQAGKRQDTAPNAQYAQPLKYEYTGSPSELYAGAPAVEAPDGARRHEMMG
ncbi:Proline-rich receptor-like protein kinase PERK1 [Madurella mycetomatis]|uniref:Proline-rich receptor-like protein kinase PERK1 n=1 Tax=Madurella mycetomatis TaxID=100816 RepID=A0A175W882_9PEZI|nr:Proline-rich receptor-like protein kinase PERK1 [Madurella mycetomatis]